MTVKDRYEGLQSLFATAYESSCHFLVLCSIAEEAIGHDIDLIWAIRTCRSRQLIDDEFYVKDDGCGILKLLTNKKWTRKDVVKLGVIRDNDYTEAEWFNPRTGFTHFRRRYFDTLNDSVTVREGYIKQYRVYTVQR